MMETTLQFRLENFEGPLDLLVALVEKHKLSVEDIPIDLLCEQYMATIRKSLRKTMCVALHIEEFGINKFFSHLLDM